MSILITRPEPGASRTKAILESTGRTCVVASLFTIVAIPGPRPTGRFAALIVTSGNGAAGLSPESANLAADIPVFAVGDTTADAVRASGFSNVQSAAGDNRALARLVLAKVAPKFRLLLATGEDHKPGLPAALTKVGYEVAVWLRYKAEAVDSLPEEARSALASAEADTVLHYSRRASEAFLALTSAAGLADRAASVQHLCLSEDVAEPLRSAGIDQVRVAGTLDETGLLALLGVSEPSAPQGTAARARRGPARSQDPVTSVPEPDDVAMTTAPAASIPESAVATEVPPPMAVALDAASSAAAPASVEAALSSVSTSPVESVGGGYPGAKATDPKGSSMTSLALTGLAGGLVGAVAITFLAPLLNQAGIRFPNSPTLAATDARLTVLEARQAGAPTAAGSSAPAASQASESVQRMASLEQRIADLAARGPAASAPDAGLAAQIAELRQKLEATERAAQSASQAAATSAQALAPRLAELERVSRMVGTPSAAANGSARLIIAERVGRAVANGEVFATEVAALTKLGAGPEQSSILSGLAQQKLATVAGLRADLARLRQSPSLQPAAGAPWHERLQGLLDSVVRVRVAGSGPAQSPSAIMDRIDNALQSGALEMAAALFGTLPEPARQDGRAFIDALQRRVSADKAIKSIMDDAIKALSGAS